METKNKNKHPLIQMVANADFTEMYFNVGAPSDDCARGLKTINEMFVFNPKVPLPALPFGKLKFPMIKAERF